MPNSKKSKKSHSVEAQLGSQLQRVSLIDDSTNTKKGNIHKLRVQYEYVVLFILPNPPFLLYFLSKMILSIGFLYKIGPI